ncbi:MAG: glycosyltransferase family 2 protein [Bauldia sp.]|nr:glycosyltransferase family 2 protein [Bauldia sp.]
MAERYSVVIPAFDAADTIVDALRSIARQSVLPARVIVVDDGSNDDTGERARAFGEGLDIVVIRQANAGCGAATNTGVATVTTPVLAYLDADDVWLPHKAEAQLAILAARPELAGICGQCLTFRGPAEAPRVGRVMDIWGRTSLMIRTEAARLIGPVVDGGRGDMVDWLARGRELGLRIEMAPETVGMRRIRSDSLSYGRDVEKDRGYLLAVKRALDRRRQERGGLE